MLFQDNYLNINDIVAITSSVDTNIVNKIPCFNAQLIPCFGRELHLLANEIHSSNIFESLLKKIENMQKIFSHGKLNYIHKTKVSISSDVSDEMWNEIELPFYSIPKWWSLLNLLEEVSKRNKSIANVLHTHKEQELKHLILTDEDVNVLKFLISLLNEIKYVMNNLVQHTYFPASLIIPEWRKLKENLQKCCTIYNQNKKNAPIKTSYILDIINLFFLEKNNLAVTVLNLCTMLDPRFKLEEYSEELEKTKLEKIAKKKYEEIKKFNNNSSTEVSISVVIIQYT